MNDQTGDKIELYGSPHTLAGEYSIGASSEVVIMIKPGGSIFWKGREVLSDDDFKKAMLDVRDALVNLNKGTTNE